MAEFISLFDLLTFQLADQCGSVPDNGGTAPEWSGVANATDLCAGSLSANYFDEFPANYTAGCSAFTRVWTAVDFCGNVGVKNQTISFERGQEPVFVIPPNVTAECGSDLALDRTGFPMIQASPCVDLTTTIDTFRVPGGVCLRRVERTFFASKTTCGAWARNATQYITQIDTKGPVIALDPVIHVTCSDGQDPSPNNTNVGFPVVFDACQGGIPRSQLRFSDVLVTLVNRPPHCLDQVTRTWFATDQCGHTSNATQVIYATRDCAPCGGRLPCQQ